MAARVPDEGIASRPSPQKQVSQRRPRTSFTRIESPSHCNPTTIYLNMEISLGRADSEPKGSDASHDDSAGTKFHATTEHISDINTVPERRQVYGKVGLQGLFSSYYVVLCASFSAIGGMLFGIDQGIVSVILVMPQFLDQFPRVSATASGAGFWKGLLTAMIELGALIGALNQGWVADKISRKYSVVVAVGIFTVGSVLQTAAQDYPMLVVARLIGGVGIGMLSMVIPLYISEISPPEIRKHRTIKFCDIGNLSNHHAGGTLLVLEEFSIVFGEVLAFWVTYGTRFIASAWSWRLPFLLQMIPAFVLAGGILFLPFSPRWLASKGRDQESLDSLVKLRQLPASDHRVQQEWLEIRAEIAFQKQVMEERHPRLQDGTKSSRIKLEIASWTDAFKSGCWRRTHVGVGLSFFQQFVGINALIYYSPTLFETMGLDYDLQLIMSGVLNIMQLLGVCSSFYTMDRFGRRPLLLWGSAGMAISHIIIAILVGKFSSNWPAHRAEGWGLITPPLVENTGFGAYTFFAVFCVLSWVWAFFFVPETNGRTLEQMDRLFKDRSNQEDEAKRKRVADAVLVPTICA
ncbi:hypothetical protein MMC08_007635 [Hypocenomyce scalaris]|nr:hypothetical protein [Hypocenomyce scalaris]